MFENSIGTLDLTATRPHPRSGSRVDALPGHGDADAVRADSEEVMRALSDTVRVHLRGDETRAMTAGRERLRVVLEPGDLLTLTPRAKTEYERVDGGRS